jgi:hypothetical protein
MSNPISFVATPKDLTTDNADAYDAFNQQGAVTDANFERINTYLRGWKLITAKSTQVSEPSPYLTNAWTDFTAGQWPRPTIVIPARMNCLMVVISGVVEHFNPAHTDQYLHLAYRFSGANSVPDQPAYWLLRGQWSQTMASRVSFFPGSQFTAGGTLTLIPRYYLNPLGFTSVGHTIYSGNIFAIALV